MPDDKSVSTSLAVPSVLIQSITGAEVSGIPEKPDKNTKVEEAQYKANKHSEEIANSKQDRDERKLYAGRIFTLICIWLGIITLIIIFQGFRFADFRLEQPVLLALIGSTTLNVVGIFVIVTRYLFPVKKK